VCQDFGIPRCDPKHCCGSAEPRELKKLTPFHSASWIFGQCIVSIIVDLRFSRLLGGRTARRFNARHKEDFVMLGRAIDEQSIGFQGVQDNAEIVGKDPDRHSITRYLSSPAVAKTIHERI
jgi:hypothetical protein